MHTAHYTVTGGGARWGMRRCVPVLGWYETDMTELKDNDRGALKGRKRLLLNKKAWDKGGLIRGIPCLGISFDTGLSENG